MINMQSHSTISIHQASHADVPLKGRRHEHINVSLLSARTSAALRRIRDGKNLDDCDRQAMSSSAKLFREAADKIANAGTALSSAHSCSDRFGSVMAVLEAIGGSEKSIDQMPVFIEIADQLNEFSDSDFSARNTYRDDVALLIATFSKLTKKSAGLGGSVGDSLLEFRTG